MASYGLHNKLLQQPIPILPVKSAETGKEGTAEQRDTLGARDPDEFAYGFNNISFWGPIAEEFLLSGALDLVQLWGGAEHHQRVEDLNKITKAARLG